MYIFAIFSSLICLQLILTVVSDTNDAGQDSLIKTPSVVNIESDEEYDYVPRSTSFLRFGRQLPASSAQFLRFGRSDQNGGNFLRFGRQPASNNFLRFGRQPASNNFLRFGKKGEFLRFG